MKEYGFTIREERPEAVEITELKVFTATNIQAVDVEREDGEGTRREYHFDLTEYEKDEYLKLLQEQIQENQDALVEIVDLFS